MTRDERGRFHECGFRSDRGGRSVIRLEGSSAQVTAATTRESPPGNLGREGEVLSHGAGPFTSGRRRRCPAGVGVPASVRVGARRNPGARVYSAASRSARSRVSERASSRCPAATARPAARQPAQSPLRPSACSAHVPTAGAAHTAPPNAMLYAPM